MRWIDSGKHELGTCHIYIYDERATKSECWFALKDDRTTENKVVSYEFELDLHDTWVGREMLRFYHSEAKEVSITMTTDVYKEWIRYCVGIRNSPRLLWRRDS